VSARFIARGVDDTGLGEPNWMPDEGELILMVRSPGDPDPRITSNFDFDFTVDPVDFIRDQPIVGVLEGAVGSISGLLISAQAICQRLGFFA
jgi:hypothetical protein